MIIKLLSDFFTCLYFSGFFIGLFYTVIPIFLIIDYTIKRRWSKKKLKVLIFNVAVAFLINPISQMWYLEGIDTKLNYKLGDKAREMKIIGKTKKEVREIFGYPLHAEAYHPIVRNENGGFEESKEKYTMWEYYPVLFYWLGSCLQIFFNEEGKVIGYDVNDD